MLHLAIMVQRMGRNKRQVRRKGGRRQKVNKSRQGGHQGLSEKLGEWRYRKSKEEKERNKEKPERTKGFNGRFQSNIHASPHDL